MPSGRRRSSAVTLPRVRFSVDGLGDLEVPIGLPLAELREALVGLAGPGIRTAVLSAGGHQLAADQVAGVPPWVSGSRLVPGDAPVGPAAEPAAAGWTLLVTAGPDAGVTVRPWQDTVRVGRAEVGPGALAATDPAVSRHHLLIRRRLGLWWVRDHSGWGTAPVKLRWAGHVHLRIGDTRLRLEPARRRESRRLETGTPWAQLLVPAVTSAVLALVTRNPVFLCFALAGPLTALASRPASRPQLELADLTRGGLAVVGDRGPELAASLMCAVLAETAPALTLLYPRPAHSTWSWCRWLTGHLGGAASARVAHDADGATRCLAPLAEPVLVVSHGLGWRAELDRWWLRARKPQDGVLVVVETPAEAPAWCRWVAQLRGGRVLLIGPEGCRPLPLPLLSEARAEHQARHLANEVEGSLPDQVALADLGVPLSVAALRQRWRHPPAGLTATIGVGASGPVTLDLASAGPHLLVAGTTGSGKSELLQSLVLALALAYPPERLAIALLDFKGGTSLGSCFRLPHVVGQVTDLDPGEAVRALESLRAELQRREQLLAAAGVGDLADLDEPPPRLLVVVDEFRTLSEELPDFVPGLVRLAAQGRALGMHLVLATQRPGGAVTPQLRANLTLRCCLRVADGAEAMDVVGVADPATFPADLPGRALLRRGPAAPEVIQTAWAALGPARREPQPALPWHRFGEGCAPGQLTDLAELVIAAGGRPARLWSPPLPDTLQVEQVGTPQAGLRLGLVAQVGAASWGGLDWDGREPLLICGAAGSGRTTALATIAAAARTAGRLVHVAAGTPAGATLIAGAGSNGTVVAADDPRRLARLLTLLLTAGGVLLVDDILLVEQALSRMGPAADLLERAVREGPRRGLAVALTAAPGDTLRLLPHCPERLVLPIAEADAALLGVPAHLRCSTHPGRGVRLGRGAACRCQVALPPRSGAPDETPHRLRLLPIPLQVRSVTTRGPGLAIGLGGDHAEPVTIAPEPLLIVGPPGSGRTGALRVIARALLASGGQFAVLATDAELLAMAPIRPAAVAAAGGLLLVDDLDAAPPAELACGTLIATARTDRAASCYRGPLADLRTGSILVLSPLTPGSAEVAGRDLWAAVDPAHPTHPGRGVLVRGDLIPLQVAQR